jgi:excisionase family DNA binding protein
VNLKTAARRLGVHYQTAYRWVRSGQLVAVKVGSGYEISDAAVERFLAQRAAAERLPEQGVASLDRAFGATPANRAEALAVLERVIDAASIDRRPIAARAARIVADQLGDAAGVYCRRPIAGDPEVSHVAHCDPVRAVDAETIARDALSTIPFAEAVFDTGTTLFLPQVPQQEVRTYLRPEMHQGLASLGCYSAICAPIMVAGLAEGALLAIRDAPGRPYSSEDVDFVEAVAARVAVGYERVSRFATAWQTRRRVLSAFKSHEVPAMDGHEHYDDRDPATIAVLLERARRDDSQAAVGLLDVESRHLGCTKAYGALFGEDVSRVVGRHLAALVAEPAKLHEACDRLTENELDMLSVDLRTRGKRRVAFHAATVRRADATKWGVLVVAHEVPELGAGDGGSDL